jgi:hypothetical protein
MIEGDIGVPEGPGLGVELDEAIVEKYRVRRRFVARSSSALYAIRISGPTFRDRNRLSLILFAHPIATVPLPHYTDE